MEAAPPRVCPCPLSPVVHGLRGVRVAVRSGAARGGGWGRRGRLASWWQATGASSRRSCKAERVARWLVSQPVPPHPVAPHVAGPRAMQRTRCSCPQRSPHRRGAPRRASPGVPSRASRTAPRWAVAPCVDAGRARTACHSRGVAERGGSARAGGSVSVPGWCGCLRSGAPRDHRGPRRRGQAGFLEGAGSGQAPGTVWGAWGPNNALEPTPNSLRSCLAAAVGRGSPRALGLQIGKRDKRYGYMVACNRSAIYFLR